MEMKRNSIIAAAVCLAALASCQKQEPVESSSLAEVDVELTASSDLNSTKTVMTEYNNHWWSVSDKISLFYTAPGATTQHSVFTSKNAIPSATAKFTGTLALPAEDTDLKTVSALAVYPVATADAYDGTSVTVNVPAEQNAVEGTFMTGAYPVVAQTSDLTAALSFKAVCGGVKVSFQTPGITSFTFDGKGAKIAGTASVTFGTDGNPVATADESAVSEITVNAPAGGFEVGKWYYMTALPATISGGYKITLHGGDADGTVLTGSLDITIKRSVFGVLDGKDVETITYAPLADKLKPISWWKENKDYMVVPTHAAEKGDQYQWGTVKNVTSCIRFTSDVDYIYGYYEATGNIKLEDFKNLGIWLDINGTKSGSGGNWLFNAYPYFDLMVYGPVESEGSMAWKSASLYGEPKIIWDNPYLGEKIETSSDAGYGEGSLENGIFKYSFIIDRRIVGLRNASSAVVGICFDSVNFQGGGYLTNPDRAGYIVPLKNSDSELIVNELKILQHVKGFDYWDNIPETPSTNAKSSLVKFDSDADYIYGYFEVTNTDNLYLNEGEVTSFDPGFVNNLAVAFDLDGVGSGQGVGWMFGGGYDKMLSGGISNYSISYSEEDTANGWTSPWGFPRIATEKFEATPKPSYSINLGSAWNPIITDCRKSNCNVGEVIEETKDWKNVATGNGEWKDNKFRYTFTIDRYRLGLKGLESVKIGVMSYHSFGGYSVVPKVDGFELKLNNN